MEPVNSEEDLPLSELEARMDPPSDLEYDDLFLAIADYVYNTNPTWSQLAWENASLALLDSLGCAMEALATNAECRKLIGPVVPNTAVPNGFCLPGTDLELDPVKGAFDMGILVRYLDHNDGFTGKEWGHPSGQYTMRDASRWVTIYRQPRCHSGCR